MVAAGIKYGVSSMNVRFVLHGLCKRVAPDLFASLTARYADHNIRATASLTGLRRNADAFIEPIKSLPDEEPTTYNAYDIDSTISLLESRGFTVTRSTQ